MDNINGVAEKNDKFGAIIDSHLSRNELLFTRSKFCRNLKTNSVLV